MRVFDFQINATCRHTAARCGCFETPHGPVSTPRFMPVGTLATVKGVTADQLATTGAQMVLSNTYHLHLQPGEAVVEAAGGLHRFMGWQGPMLTDSGGFQVFSLAQPTADFQSIHAWQHQIENHEIGALTFKTCLQLLDIAEASDVIALIE